MKRFFGSWDHYDSMIRDFFEPNDIIFPREGDILFASYGHEGYEGYATVILQSPDGLYEVAGSHCSCHGLEDQWDPKPVTWEALALRLKDMDGGYGFLYDHPPEARAAFRQLVESHLPN